MSQRLYNLGGRKFVIAGLGRMGCIPSILAQNPSGTCSDEVNRLVLPFNTNVKTMINNLNTNLPGSKFIYIDIARMFEDMLLNSRSYGMLATVYLIGSHYSWLNFNYVSVDTSDFNICAILFVGFSVANRGCCGIGRNRGQVTCLPFQTPCPNRDQYIFWDAFHPTSAVNIIIGRKAFSGDRTEVYPMNIQQLATLDIERNQ